MTDEPATRTLTYRELADALGISLRAAEARARRRVRQGQWRPVRGNDGTARFMVPVADLQAERTVTEGAAHPLTAGNTERATRGDTYPHADARTLTDLQAALARLTEQLAAELRETRDLADQRTVELTELRERVGRAEAEAVVRRDAETRERERAERAEAARRGAEEELAGWVAGSPLARAWRALIYRRGRS